MSSAILFFTRDANTSITPLVSVLSFFRKIFVDSLSFLLQGKQKLRKSPQKTNHPHCQYQIHSCHEMGVNLHININFEHSSFFINLNCSQMIIRKLMLMKALSLLLGVFTITKTSFSECHLCQLWQKHSTSKTKTSVQLFIFQPLIFTMPFKSSQSASISRFWVFY